MVRTAARTSQYFYNVPCVLKLEGNLGIAVLTETLNEIIKRHEILRTVFISDRDKNPIQVVRPFQEFELPIVEVVMLGVRSRDVRSKEELIENII